MELKGGEGFFLYGSVCKDFFTIKTLTLDHANNRHGQWKKDSKDGLVIFNLACHSYNRMTLVTWRASNNRRSPGGQESETVHKQYPS